MPVVGTRGLETKTLLVVALHRPRLHSHRMQWLLLADGAVGSADLAEEGLRANLPVSNANLKYQTARHAYRRV